MPATSKRPRISLDVNPDLIPSEMAALNRWVNWKPVWAKKKARWDKPPVDGKIGHHIDSTNAINLKSLASVLEAQERNRKALQEAIKLPPDKERPYIPRYGVGFSLAKGLPGLHGLKGIDLDHCITSRGIDQWAKDIVDDLRTYTETSPSGTGLRLFVRGELPDGYKHKVTGLGPEGKGVLEVYEEGRYLTVTGDAELRGLFDGDFEGDWWEAPIACEAGLYGLWIEERDLSCLLPYISSGANNSKHAHRGGEEKTAEGPVMPDEVIVAQLVHLPLWNGDTSGHDGDHSAADLALCNLIAQYTDDPDQIDRIFRQSGLMREKWERADYRERTINKALEGSREPETSEPEPSCKPTGEGKKNPWTKGDRGDALMVKSLPEQQWAVEGLIPEGVTLLAGTKSIGKSWMALNLALAVSSGGRAFDKIPVQQGDVLYLNLEDGERRLQSRLHTILNSDSGFSGLKHFYPRYDSPLLGAGLESGLASWVDDYPQTKLVVIDLLANVFMPRDRKSEYFETYKVLSRLRKIADDTRTPILVLHHTNTRPEDDLNDPFDAIHGGQAIKGCVAGCMVLRRARGNTEMSLMIAGKDIREGAFTLQRDDAWHIRLLDEPPQAALSPERMAYRRAVEAGHHTPMEVSKLTGRPIEGVKKGMARMAEVGQLTRTGKGLYNIPVK